MRLVRKWMCAPRGPLRGSRGNRTGSIAKTAFKHHASAFTPDGFFPGEAVAGVVKDGAEILTEEFYDRMLQHPRASAFLDQDRVQKRLRASLRGWMTELFAPLSEADRLIALIYVSDLLHLADSLMNHAYLRDAQDVVRNDEAFRLVTQKRSATVERARQRAALSEWAEGLLMAAWGQARGPLVRLRDSEFGIWIHHKGVVLFDGAPDWRGEEPAGPDPPEAQRSVRTLSGPGRRAGPGNPVARPALPASHPGARDAGAQRQRPGVQRRHAGAAIFRVARQRCS